MQQIAFCSGHLKKNKKKIRKISFGHDSIVKAREEEEDLVSAMVNQL